MLRLCICLVCILYLCGCPAIRQTAIDVSEEEFLNMIAARTIALNYLEIWPMQSGFLRGALGHRMDEMPTHAIEAMDELDRLAELCNQEDSTCMDHELGLSLGLRIRLLGTAVQSAIRTYAPDVIQYVPLIF